MATKKSNVSKTAKKPGFKFHWWMAVVLICVIAVIGIAVLRFSRAGGLTYTDFVDGYSNDYSSDPLVNLRLKSSGLWYRRHSRLNYFVRNNPNGTKTCAYINKAGFKKISGNVFHDDAVTVSEAETVTGDCPN